MFFAGEAPFWQKRRLGKPSCVICCANTRISPAPPPPKPFNKKGLAQNRNVCVWRLWCGWCSLFAQTCVFLWRLCIWNSSFSREKLLVIVRRSRRHSALLHSSVLLRSASLAYAKLRGLRGLLAILLSDDRLKFYLAKLRSG